ncbi:MAG: hypothetical protein J6T22_09350 [Bacteroidales bacterium]|nr:hypothetical protein [Bacteroidales bacterium]MBO7617399.1 hypothetical protein [Bacteroidales bacterium]
MMEELLKIINYYGEKNQIRKLAEEQYELNEALFERFVHGQDEFSIYDDDEKEAWEYDKNILDGHIEEEIADNLVIIRQFVALYGLDMVRIEDIVRKKIERQLERMKNLDER